MNSLPYVEMMMTRIQMSLTSEEGCRGDTNRAVYCTLIRDAVHLVYGAEQSSDDDLAMMRRSFGTWSDHETDGEALVDRLRSGSGLRRDP